MPKKATKNPRHEPEPQPETLRGWHAIANYLGQPLTTLHRWAKDGMPVQKQGRNVTADPAELSRWLGRESGAKDSVHLASAQDSDLLTDLKRGLSEARSSHKSRRRR